MIFFIEPFPYIGLFPAFARDMLYTITYPFTIFSLMTLLLHWHKMVSPNVHLRSVDSGLNNLKWPLIIVTLLWTFVTFNLIILSGNSKINCESDLFRNVVKWKHFLSNHQYSVWLLANRPHHLFRHYINSHNSFSKKSKPYCRRRTHQKGNSNNRFSQLIFEIR